MVIPEVLSADNIKEPRVALSPKARLRMVAPSALKRIEHLMSLRSNWDGYGGLPISDNAVRVAIQLLLQVHRLTKGEPKLPFIAPQPDGGLEMEWIQDSGKELTLVVPADGNEIEYLLDIPADGDAIEESEGVLNIDAQLSALISRLD